MITNQENFTRGSIWIAWDSQSRKSRPFIIINPMSEYGVYAFALPSTSQAARDKYDVLLRDWEEANLKQATIARVSWGKMLPFSAFNYHIGKLTDFDMLQIEKAILDFNGISHSKDS